MTPGSSTQMTQKKHEITIELPISGDLVSSVPSVCLLSICPLYFADGSDCIMPKMFPSESLQ